MADRQRCRGAVDGWDFKQYVLGTLFYRFISENFASYVEGGDDSIDYAMLPDSVITPDIKEDAIKTKDYFIYPSQLFSKVAAGANTNESLNTHLASIFAAIETSANGYPSEQDIKGLFADFDTTSNRLGNTVRDKNTRLAAVLKGVAELEFGEFDASHIDLFGDAYEFLISNYAANAGKSGGEFFTPQHVSKLIAQLAMHQQTRVNKIYDPACGSGSLLLQAKKHFDAHVIEDGFYGQEINHTTQFIDASGLFKKETNNNVLTDNEDEENPGHIQQIMRVFDSKADIEHFAKSVSFESIKANDYNLSVSSYVEAKDNREEVDIAQLNAELKITVARIDQLRTEIDAIVAEIEGEEQQA